MYKEKKIVLKKRVMLNGMNKVIILCEIIIKNTSIHTNNADLIAIEKIKCISI